MKPQKQSLAAAGIAALGLAPVMAAAATPVIDQSLCLTPPHPRTFNESLPDINKAISMSNRMNLIDEFADKPAMRSDVEYFATGPEAGKDVMSGDITTGHIFLRISVTMQGQPPQNMDSMFDIDAGTACQIAPETYDAVKQAAPAP